MGSVPLHSISQPQSTAHRICSGLVVYSVCVTYIRMWGHVMPACWIDRLQSFHSALQSSLYIYYSKSHQLCAEQLGMRNIQVLHNYYSMMFVHHATSYFNFMVDANYE